MVDAGGAGFVLLLDAALHVVDGRPLPPAPAVDDVLRTRGRAAPRDTPVGDLRYEVMYFLDLGDAEIARFKEAWGRIGDSIVVVGGEGLWNCHVHTDDIGGAIEAALTAGGRPWQIRVTDLHDEAAAEHDVREEAMRRPRTCGVVAVADGAGLVDLLGRLGVQEVVVGGQTMNPSTAELLEAVERVAAGQVVLLPANGNILPVAEQAAALTGKVARVVPACSIPEALAALVAYDPGRAADENAERMAEAMAGVAVGEVTQAVRAATSPAGAVEAGDWIGLIQGDGIVAVASSAVAAAIATLDRLVTAGPRAGHRHPRRRRRPGRARRRCGTGWGRRDRMSTSRSTTVGSPSTRSCSVPSERGAMTAITLRQLDERSVAELKGVGPKKVAALESVGVTSVLDLLTTYPRRWVDRTEEARVIDLVARARGAGARHRAFGHEAPHSQPSHDGDRAGR